MQIANALHAVHSVALVHRHLSTFNTFISPHRHVAVLPILVQRLTGVATLTISGTAILIVVSVALETMRQVDSQLTMREYEGIE